jgi:hypothetical protein
MASKRSSGDIYEPATKRRRDFGAFKSTNGNAVDQTYGQRSAFGSLKDSTAPVDDELDFLDDSEALEYLRTVR